MEDSDQIDQERKLIRVFNFRTMPKYTFKWYPDRIKPFSSKIADDKIYVCKNR